MELVDKSVSQCPWPPMLWDYQCDAKDAEHALCLIAGVGVDMWALRCPCGVPLKPRQFALAG
jgi:hypothetical protein